MDYSDSESGGSHISSTPPRQPYQPPPPPPPPPPPKPQSPALHTLIVSAKQQKNPKSKARSSSSRPILNIKPSIRRTKPPPPESEPKNDGSDLFQRPIPSTTRSSDINLPFQIRRSSGCNPFDTICPTETLPAGSSCLSKFPSFSKIRRPCLNFESTEKGIGHGLESKVGASDSQGRDVDVRDSERVVKKHPNLIGSCGSGLEEANTPDSKFVNETVGGDAIARDSGKAVKKHPNLIGSCVFPTQQVTKPKLVNEGNFVRLNINGHGGRKKFAYKVRKRNQNAYNAGRKSYKRSKRKLKSGGQAEEERSFCEEEGWHLDENQETDMRLDLEVIEKAALDVRHDPSDENLVKLLKLTHGYDSFRDGQLETIKLLLAGKSSMVILPTGAGKSLCYQLPAIVLQGMTLVISPLVALMFDQLKQLPPVIPGGLLCSSQTLEESSETLRRVQEGALKVLFVSPERLLNAEFTSIFSATSLISLVVIDEAHCISEWSHNFRPSYMRLRASLLRSSLGVECILAMTATATTKTMHDVMCSLEIPPSNLVQAAQIRDNLQLSVSLSGNRQVKIRMKDLMALLKAPPYMDVKSIIIYCKYQSETDMISKFLCDSNIRAKSYHSGILAKDRRRTQELFCSNKIRVIVATVAFGMGLDKSDVGAFLSASVTGNSLQFTRKLGRVCSGLDNDPPSSFHVDHYIIYLKMFDLYRKLDALVVMADHLIAISFLMMQHILSSGVLCTGNQLHVQEVFCCSEEILALPDGLDQYTVNKFLSQVFSTESNSKGSICSLVKESASRKFDMKEEVLEALES
ncbi:Actin-binding FH2 [Cynara cardunculus var. scolymus]|uniref:DNA 3'-5' helicase n=1 Tax=Cynara cardunculus var. scolymus TaxID=59895 RepID=A0A103XVW8_CYNCS|nr:Actin-binding FH2 [Cynara cardunculus var. scolymus]